VNCRPEVYDKDCSWRQLPETRRVWRDIDDVAPQGGNRKQARLSTCTNPSFLTWDLFSGYICLLVLRQRRGKYELICMHPTPWSITSRSLTASWTAISMYMAQWSGRVASGTRASRAIRNLQTKYIPFNQHCLAFA